MDENYDGIMVFDEGRDSEASPAIYCCWSSFGYYY
jgi:hypothetical protein